MLDPNKHESVLHVPTSGNRSALLDFVEFFALLCMLFCEVGMAMAQELAVQRELLMFKEIPIVITATRRAQRLTQAPSAITIITGEEIRQSGATSLPALLQVVPGLDMFRTSASNVSIATRGLNKEVPVRIQVLVDGLSIYEDLADVVFWYQIPLALEEIERIEIIRSPATALYGTKAFGGIIHIITKSPEALKGTHFSGTAGEAGTGIGNLIHAGVHGNLTYKASLGYDRTNQFPNPPVSRRSDELGREDTRGYFLVNYKLAAGSGVSLSGGIDDFERREVFPAGPLQLVLAGHLGFVKAHYELDDFKVQLSSYHFDADITSPTFFADISSRLNVFQAQLQHSLVLASTHILTGGTTYRFVAADSELIGGSVHQHLATFFLQDEWKLRDNLALTVGVGVDVHPQAGVSASPRGSLVYSPWQDHTFRLSIGRGFRNPSLIENFQSITTRFLPPQPPPLPQTFLSLGNRDLDPEEIHSYEVGYQTQLLEQVRLRIDFFANHLEQLIDFQRPIFSPVSPLLPPVPAGRQFINVGSGEVIGMEVGIEVLLSSWLTGFLNYSYQDRRGHVSAMGFAPHHKGNAGLTGTFPNGLSATTLVHYVGELDTPASGVGAYTLTNVHVGYRWHVFGHETELALQVFNLFNEVHREVPGGDLIERRVSGTIRSRF